MPDLFKMFSMTENYKISNSRGTGLGLNSCLKIAEILTFGKKINVESVFGIGSSFSFEINNYQKRIYN